MSQAVGLQRLRGAQLYAGPELAEAGDRSSLGDLADAKSPMHWVWSAKIDLLLADVLNASLPRMYPSNLMVRGTERVSGTPMHILFRGQLRVVDFCAQHIFGTPDFERLGGRAHAGVVPDVIVVDHPLVENGRSFDASALSVPQWLRQCREIDPSWAQTVNEIPTSLRKRIARLLGRDVYEVRLESSDAAKRDFYERLYLPYVRQRFGQRAIVANERTYLQESRGGLLLQLFSEGRLLGATLIRAKGHTLLMGKSGLTLEHDVGHVFDLLDYFCFLVAHLSGARYVDFGVSRPHLDDGVFANKTKWRPSLLEAGGIKSTIRIKPASRSPATLAFMRRNGFIETRPAGFVIRRLYDPAMTGEDLERVGDLAARSGLDKAIVGCSEAAVAAPADYTERVQVCGPDPVRAFLEQT